MTLRDIPTLLIIIAQLIGLLGRGKAKKIARGLLPNVLEGIELWGRVSPKLEALAQSDEDVARFRELIDSTLETIRG